VGGSAEQLHDEGARRAASPEPLPESGQAGIAGVRSKPQLARALASAAPGVRAALARRLQSAAGNRAVQQLALESRRLQRYKDTDRAGDWKAVTGGNAIGRIADSGETLTFSSHEAYATADLIQNADGMLAIKDSGVHLYATDASKTIDAPDGSGPKTLYGLGVNIKVAPPTNQTLPGDCREAALEVAGKGPGRGPEKVTITEGGQRVEIQGTQGDASDAAVRAMLVDKKIHETANYGSLDTAARLKVAEEAQKSVDSMSRAEKEAARGMAIDDARAKEIGVDVYANPGVGDAFTAVTAPAPMPGQYKFHFATVIMAPGQDRVTLENEGESPGVRNVKWKIETYSTSEKRKTFHEEHAALTQPGHTFVVRTGPPPPSDSAKIVRMTTPDLITRFLASQSADDQAYIQKELLKRSVNVVVAVDHTEDADTDEVYAIVTNSPSKSAKTGKASVKAGEAVVLKLPLGNVWPLTKELAVAVFEWDLTSPDDLIGTIKWASPFVPTNAVALAAGTARYRVALDIN
jgi:hypothetical protein